MSTLSDRLRWAMSQAGIGQTELARACGIKPPSVNWWLSWKSKFLRGENLLKAAAALNVSDVWLATGEGSSARGSGSPEILIVSTHETASDYVRVEQIGEAEMGDGRENEDMPDVIRTVEYSETFLRSLIGFLPPPGRLKLVTGRGDSMLPTIAPGEVVLVDTGVQCYDNDGLYLVNSGGGQQIKRLQHLGDGVHVVSDNPAYKSFLFPKHGIVGGKVYLINRLTRVN